jgi:mono/diheme cytochrome c family protein
MTSRRSLAGHVPALFVAMASATAACDNRGALHEPDPTFARMLSQRRADPYEATSAFPDRKVMRAPPEGTVPTDDDTDAPAPPVTRALLDLGRARFAVVCAVCHGLTGTGESVVATKMELRAPPSIVNDENRARTRERLFEIVTKGYGLMASYAELLPREERWAVVAYLQALQLSQHAPVAELPAPVRDQAMREGK